MAHSAHCSEQLSQGTGKADGELALGSVKNTPQRLGLWPLSCATPFLCLAHIPPVLAPHTLL